MTRKQTKEFLVVLHAALSFEIADIQVEVYAQLLVSQCQPVASQMVNNEKEGKRTSISAGL